MHTWLLLCCAQLAMLRLHVFVTTTPSPPLAISQLSTASTHCLWPKVQGVGWVITCLLHACLLLPPVAGAAAKWCWPLSIQE
jgi:hypothetical protein